MDDLEVLDQINGVESLALDLFTNSISNLDTLLAIDFTLLMNKCLDAAQAASDAIEERRNEVWNEAVDLDSGNVVSILTKRVT